MRTSTSHIMDTWKAGGPFVGPNGKPHTRVTIQTPFDGNFLHTVRAVSWKRGVPLRWYQNSTNSQVEIEVPNVRDVTIDRNVDQVAASCQITIANQWMRDNGEPQPGLETGEPGYFTPTRGSGMEARARWGHVPNEWRGALVPNALLRTYQGYGGHAKELDEAVADGNLMLTGVWLVDAVSVGAKGDLSLECRDMAKLLIEQQLYLPLVPADKYPLKYYRWIYKTKKVLSHSVTRTTVSAAKPGIRRVTYSDSASDRWYGYNANLHGHRPLDSLDGRADTYWLSVGNSGPDRPFTTDWIQYNVNSEVNAIRVHTWGGNYQMYVSVMVNGQWLGSQTIPYDYTPLIGTQPRYVDTGANIKYVAMYGTPWEASKIYTLPAMYHAQKIRISFRHHTRSPWGPWYYRCGVREFQAMVSATGPKGGPVSVTYQPLHTFAEQAKPSWVGYLAADGFDNVDAFGDGRRFVQSGGPPAQGTTMVVTQRPQGDGYWTLTGSGEIRSFGAADDLGDPERRGLPGNWTRGHWQAMCVTASGEGYWIINTLGGIEAFGDATEYPDLPKLTYSSPYYYRTADSHPDHPGFIVARTDGRVISIGGAPTFGNWVGTTRRGINSIISLRYNMEGDGYWLMTESGVVQAKGNCDDHGGGVTTPAITNDWYKKYWSLVPQEDGGYLVLRGDGEMYPIGTEYFFGGPVPGGTAVLRRDGNYKDYSDIIKDLALWSGFLLYQTGSMVQEPNVYGNIESTGSYAKEPLPDEIFDKRPVSDAMNELKEAVGYLLWVDEEGALRFQSPNWWAPGNFNELGERLTTIPEIDERVNLTEYRAAESDDPLRSYIIIASEDPDEASESTISTKIVPPSARRLRGLVKPAMWVNGWFQDKDEQQLMAELIALHIHFQSRLGEVTCVANPAIQIDDQVRIIERVTNESLIHYVRGISTTHDLKTGTYTMTLTTHQLGTNEGWLIGDVDDSDYLLSPRVLEYLKDSPSKAAAAFVASIPAGSTSYATGQPSPTDGQGE